MMIIQVILVPVILGLLIRRVLPRFADKTITVMPLVSVLAILTIITAVVGANTESLAASGLIAFIAVMLTTVPASCLATPWLPLSVSHQASDGLSRLRSACRTQDLA